MATSFSRAVSPRTSVTARLGSAQPLGQQRQQGSVGRAFHRGSHQPRPQNPALQRQHVATGARRDSHGHDQARAILTHT